MAGVKSPKKKIGIGIGGHGSPHPSSYRQVYGTNPT